jgi:L-2-hydroxyglutarate oxidase
LLVLPKQYYDVAIIGGGILGASIAYFISASSSNSVILLEREKEIAVHASSRNTGKVHAPFLYDPINKGLFARAAYLGFQMLREYCDIFALPFKQDGVLSVATYDKGIDILHKYLDWGISNGLQGDELYLIDNNRISKIEPNVRCLSAIYCSRDASVDYGSIARHLVHNASELGCTVAKGMNAVNVKKTNKRLEVQIIPDYSNFRLIVDSRKTDRLENKSNIKDSLRPDLFEAGTNLRTSGFKIYVNYLINAAGGNALNIAHQMNIAKKYNNLYFRGEYWLAPPEYQRVTKLSIYSVPMFPEFPFLDPHWVVRYDGSNEIGPNAVPVLGPYGYDWRSNLRRFTPKVLELAKNSGILKHMLNSRFIYLLGRELLSSVSKTAMINRVRKFLPILNPSLFTQRGTSGIRSLLVDNNGKFLPEMIEFRDESSLHILNYNSPGATGALPISASIVSRLIKDGLLQSNREKQIRRKDQWNIHNIDSKLSGKSI